MKIENSYVENDFKLFKKIILKSIIIGIIILSVLLVLSVFSVISFFTLLGYGLGLIIGIICFILTIKSVMNSNYVFYSKSIKRSSLINKLIMLATIVCGYFVVNQDLIAFLLIPVGILTTKIAILIQKMEEE